MISFSYAEDNHSLKLLVVPRLFRELLRCEICARLAEIAAVEWVTDRRFRDEFRTGHLDRSGYKLEVGFRVSSLRCRTCEFPGLGRPCLIQEQQ